MSVSTAHVSVLLSVVCLGLVFVGGLYLQSGVRHSSDGATLSQSGTV